jgi:tRNA A-37 threonylcarbamoyl transferase component Bud32
MSSASPDNSGREARLAELIAEYLEAVEAARPPDREAWLAQHPDLADDLRAFLAAHDRMAQVGAPLRALASAQHTVSEPPIPSPGETHAGVSLGRVRYFGDYELLEEIARGGMGVVYKARQTSLQRVVALKMILRGELATGRDVARFKVEAEAAASLDHPHIVPIYEVGEHEGQHYFSMKLVEGGSLAQAGIRGPRSGVSKEMQRQGARLLAQVARAVHHAHQRGILHRDLKPSNILLQVAETSGQPAIGNLQSAIPMVTDFGLAKRVQEQGSLSPSGAIVGTPSYMAPEQASPQHGAGGGVTMRSDVYSLGAVLYELLTGRPPFQAATPLDTVLQVLGREPEPPRRLNPRIDQDLETVCLKCIQKEAGKRYGSAEALAEDLERWLRGEPILARPVGSLGRFQRWCRRNPAVAALTGAVAAALMAVIGMLIYVAVQANHRANAERAERERAQAAEDNLERETALSLIGPLDPQGATTLSQPEVEALWRLAGTTSERVRLRFLEGALRTESMARQLGHRAQWFVHGAVGLDTHRRARTEQLLAEGMKDPGRSLRHRTEIAWATLELSERGSSTQRASAAIIRQGWAAEEDSKVRDTWAEVLLARAEEFAPADAAQLLTRASAQANLGALEQLAERLVAVAGRLEPAEATHVYAEAARWLNQALTLEVEDGNARLLLAEGLVAVAGRLEPEEGARLLVQALPQQKDDDVREMLATCLAAVARRLEPAEAARLLNQKTLAQTLAQEKGALDRWRLAEGLALPVVAGRLEPAEVARLLNLTLAQEKDDFYFRPLFALGLATAAERLEPAEAARVCGDAARLLNKALAQEKNYHARWRLAEGLAAVAGRLEPAEAARVCGEAARLLNKALAQEKNDDARRQLAEGLAAVAGRLEPAEAARVCGEAARLLNKALAQRAGTTAHEDETPSHGFLVAGTIGGLARRQLAAGLVAVAGRLEPAEAGRLLKQALAQVKEDIHTDSWEYGAPRSVRGELARGLTVVAGKLEPAEAGRLLNQALAQEKDVNAHQQLAASLVAVAGRVEPNEAARLLNQALAPQKKGVNFHHQQLAAGLVTVAGRVEPNEAARLLNQALAQEKDVNARQQLAAGLAAVAGRLEPAEAARVCGDAARLLNQALAQAKDDNARQQLAAGLAAVAGRLEPAEAARVCAEAVRLLNQALAQEEDVNGRLQLAAGLAAIVGQLGPVEADRVVADSSRSQVSALEREPREWDRRIAAECVSLLIQPLDSEEASHVARVFTRWIVSDPNFYNPDFRYYLDPRGIGGGGPGTSGLGRFLIQATRPLVRQRAVAATAAVGTTLGGALASLASLQPASEPLPCRLSTQHLVELLKMPTCVGDVRRVILDQLGNRYGRRFDTHWDFVRYAQEQGLNLDFTTPPQRPDRKLPPLFEP